MAKALIARFVESVKPQEKRKAYSDGNGLWLLVTPTGAKSWSYSYRVRGKQRWLHLGTFPAVSLAEARKEALSYRRIVEVEKRDPVADAKAKAAIPAPLPEFTFNDMARIYIAAIQNRNRSWKNTRRAIDLHLAPKWGTRPLRSIIRRDAYELLEGLAATGMKANVNRVQSFISGIFSHAVERGHVDANPMTRMKKLVEERPRERVLTDDELRALWQGLTAAAEAGNRGADALRIRMLTGQRGNESFFMERNELDLLKELVWVIPAARCKNKRSHIVPISPTVKEIIEQNLAKLPEHESRVFPQTSGLSRTVKNLSTLHGGSYRWIDLRRTVATRLAEMGVDEVTISRVLNHARHSVTAKHYNKHAYTNEKREALNLWDQELQRIIRDEPRQADTVIDFDRRSA
jgi:integrase